MKIFISSNPRDQEFVGALVQFLLKQGHEVEPTTASASSANSILKIISKRVKEADLFIVVWSRYTRQSQNAMHELKAIKTLADTVETKNLLPILLDATIPPPEFSRYPIVFMDRERPSFTRLRSLLNENEFPHPANLPVEDRQADKLDTVALKNAHQDGKLTLVCGAGVSIGADIPPWSILLDRLLNEMLKRLVSEKTDIDAARTELQDIRENSSLIAGRYLKSVLKDDFQEEVRKALYKESKETCDVLKSIVELARPKRGKAHLDSIISFNFDDLLEQNFKSASIEHKPIFSEGSRNGPTELPIYHVHGYLPQKGKLSKKNEIVFSEDSYHDQFVDPFSWSNLTQLNKFTQNTCLFVGLSMTDPNLRRLLDVAMRRDGEGGARHFAILKRSSNSSKNRMMESLREQDAASLGISILWVNEYEEIPKLITGLA